MKFLAYIALVILLGCTVVFLFEFTQNPWIIMGIVLFCLVIIVSQFNDKWW
jgi:CDP-diglyceride synthetase